MNCKMFFLTFPQNDLDKAEFMLRLTNDLPRQTKVPLSWGIVVREKHKDDSPHLHAILCFERPLQISNCRFFDFLGGKHGDVKPVTNLKNQLAYLYKYDTEPLKFGNVPAPAKDGGGPRGPSKADEVALSVLAGKSFDDIVATHPGFALLNKRKLDEFIGSLAAKGEMEGLERLVGITVDMAAINAPTRRIIGWCQANLFGPRTFKQPQLYVWGPTNTRKTSFVNVLAKYFRPFRASSSAWFDGYSDDRCDIAIFDEFESHQKLGDMNMFLEGGHCTLSIKGSFVVKRKNIPVVILSNYSPEENFMKSTGRDAFIGRLLVVETTEQEIIDLSSVQFTSEPKK